MKLNLRDFFWLLLLAACLCGWWRSSYLAQTKLALTEQQAREFERQKWASSYPIWDVSRAWSKEVNRELTIETPDGVIHVDTTGGVRNWSHPGENPPIDVKYKPLPPDADSSIAS